MKGFGGFLSMLGILVAFFAGIAFALYRGTIPTISMIVGGALAGVGLLIYSYYEKKERDPELEKFCELMGC